jgi:hypothetical protein
MTVLDWRGGVVSFYLRLQVEHDVPAYTMEALTAGAVTSFGAAIDNVFSKALSFTGRCDFAFPQSLPVQLPAMQLRAHILPVTFTQQSKTR